MAKEKTTASVTKPTPVVSRSASNSTRRMAKDKLFKEFCLTKKRKVARGTARSLRRELARKSGLKGENFPEIWGKFLLKEQGKLVEAQ